MNLQDRQENKLKVKMMPRKYLTCFVKCIEMETLKGNEINASHDCDYSFG